MPDFDGFSRELVRFFEELKKNNNKDWFDANRQDYDRIVVDPSREFVTRMGERLRDISPTVRAIPKVNQSLFRLNRDTRFSRDKTPYKTNVGIWFWEGVRKRMECSGFYFHLGDGKLMLGVGLHIFPAELLKLFRDAVVDKTLGPRLKKVADRVAKAGYSVGGKHYKRIPRGYDAPHDLEEFLLHNGLAAMIETKIPAELYSKKIVEYAFSHFKKMSPLHDWLLEALG